MRKTLAKILAGTLLLAASTSVVYCQTQYPANRITVFVIGPGGSNDLAARTVAQGLAGELGQPVVVENRAGVIPAQTVSRAQPDGYTLLYSGGSIWVAPLLGDVPYDIVKDFAPISLIHDAPQILVAHPSLPVKNVKELIALAKSRPGQINFGASTPGAASTLAGELLNYMAGINIVRIPYKTGGERMTGLLSGEVQLEFATGAAYTSHLKVGKLKALGVTTPKRSPLWPGVAAIAETIPGYESSQVGGLFAPARTPTAIVNRLNVEVSKLLKRQDVRDKILNAGIEVVPPNTPEQFAAHVKSEMERMGKVIKARGLRITQ